MMPDTTARMLTIKLPLPDKRLHPNGGKRHNHHALNRLKKEASQIAWAETLSAMNRCNIEGPVAIDWHFFMPTPQAMQLSDRDNLRSWMKAYQDGISQAIGINDREFGDGLVLKDVDRKDPCVRATVRRWYPESDSDP